MRKIRARSSRRWKKLRHNSISTRSGGFNALCAMKSPFIYSILIIWLDSICRYTVHLLLLVKYSVYLKLSALSFLINYIARVELRKQQLIDEGEELSADSDYDQQLTDYFTSSISGE